MNAGPLVFLGSFFALALSWLGFVLAPQLQIGNQQPVDAEGVVYPRMRPGLARQGEQVYRANGCNYCHSQQVRFWGYGGDTERGWGGRKGQIQSVNEDYLYDRPVMLGSQRVGPDLANIGLRANVTTNENQNAMLLLMHIYDPKSTMPNSVMPPYRYLFEKRKLAFGAKRSDDALPINTPELQGYEVLPTDEARALAAYLLSLHSDATIFETPPPPKNTNAVPTEASTNAPAATNSVTTNAPKK